MLYFLIRSRSNVTLIGVHTRPDTAVEETNSLVNVCKWAKKELSCSKKIIVLGENLNAGRPYFNRNDFANSPLRNAEKYQWLIKDSEDTTATSR